MNTTTLKELKNYTMLRKEQIVPLVSGICVIAAYITFAAAHKHLFGMVLFGLALVLIGWLPIAARRYMASLLLASLLLALMPFRTVPVLRDFVIVVSMMAGAVLIVYLVSRYFEREHLVHFNFDWHRKWRAWELGYIVLIVGTVYFLMPYYFASTGAIHAWYFRRDIGEIAAVFGSTMIIGIWEEFFFTATVLGVLRKYLPFFWANSLQAAMFAGFLYAVGFHYWAPFGMFGYAWAQGWVFNKTRSLLFVLVVHVCVDLLVCFVLLHAYYPDLVRIFVT